MAAKTVQASFPSNLERTVASVLLLLSRSDCGSGSPQSLESAGYSDSGGSSSSTEEVCFDDEFSPAPQLTDFAFLSAFDEMTLKMARKKRSKTICISSGKKLKSSDMGPTSGLTSCESFSEITTTEPSSCTTSSAQSFSSETNDGDKPSKKPVMQSHIKHKAEAILKFLSNGSASEVSIRQFLGDNPSISKALRTLLKLHEVKRYGAGGRTNPFIYTIAD